MNVAILNIGRRIRQYREARGDSLYRLSKLSGISHKNVSNIEDGVTIPTIETLCKILPHVGLTLSELFRESEESFYVTDQERRLLQSFRTLDEEQRENILKLIGYITEK